MFTKTEILDISDIHKNTWDEFLKKYSYSTVFHTQEWMKTLQEAHGYEPKYLAGMNNDDSFSAAIPFMIDTRFGIKNYLSMPYDTYGGVIGNGEDRLNLSHLFLNLPGCGVRYYVDYESMHYGDLVTNEILTISSSLDEIWNNFHKGNQRSIKSALKNNIVIQMDTSDKLNFLDRVSPELVASIIKYMVPPEYCIPYVAKINSTIVSSSLFFIYGDMALYWTGTTNESGRKLNAHHLLMWEAIQYAKARGCKIFNFGASPPNANTLMQFKKSWGTTTHYYIKKQRIPKVIYPLYKLRQVLRG
jgi:hypothetical protein